MMKTEAELSERLNQITTELADWQTEHQCDVEGRPETTPHIRGLIREMENIEADLRRIDAQKTNPFLLPPPNRKN